jgi:hypothetical protein
MTDHFLAAQPPAIGLVIRVRVHPFQDGFLFGRLPLSLAGPGGIGVGNGVRGADMDDDAFASFEACCGLFHRRYIIPLLGKRAFDHRGQIHSRLVM